MTSFKSSRNRHLCRRGVSIIEMLMMMSIIAVVLGASVIQIQLLMKLDQTGRARIEQTATWERLGRQLRRDLHEAFSAEPMKEKEVTGIRLRIADEMSDQIEYRLDRNDIVRVEMAKGKRVRREVYTIPHTTDSRFEIRTESNNRFVALVLTRTIAKAHDAPSKVDEILAAIGRHRAQASSNPTGAKS